MLKKLLATYPDKVDGQQAVADKKAQLIYAALEAYPDAYRIVPDKSVRSRMNICFRVTKVGPVQESIGHASLIRTLQGGNVDESEKAFLKQSTDLGLTGLKGHRSVGGIRASNYNSIPLEGAEKLAAFLNKFATS